MITSGRAAAADGVVIVITQPMMTKKLLQLSANSIKYRQRSGMNRRQQQHQMKKG